MSNDPVIVLGGGLIGLAVAHQLASQGRRVEILSRKKAEAAGLVAAGMLAPHAEGLSGDLLKLAKLSLENIPHWIDEIEKTSSISCELKFSGIVVPFINETERDKHPNATSGNILNRNELEKEVPGLGKQWKTGLLFSQDGQIDNRRYLIKALEQACNKLGVIYREGVEVIKLIQKDQRLTGVQIKCGRNKTRTLHCETAVLCCGAWSNQLLKAVPIFPVKGQMFSIQAPKNALKRIIFGPNTYLVPRKDGLIIVGATLERNSGFNNGLTPFGYKQLSKNLNELMPLATKWPQMEHWWGFRPCTPDELPFLGSSPISGLWLATGHYRNGVLLAAITAKLLGKAICNQAMNDKEINLLNAFSWQRKFKKEQISL